MQFNSIILQNGTFIKFAKDQNIKKAYLKPFYKNLALNTPSLVKKNMVEFSVGQKNKVLIAKSLCEKSHLYLWDEPFNFIDILSRMQIENLILKFKSTLLFVEHDKAFS